MKRLPMILVGLTVVTVTLSVAQPAFADDTNIVTASDTVQALASTPGVLSDSSAVQTTADANSAATSTVDGTTVDVPKNASDGVGLSSNTGTALTIAPPVGDTSGAGTEVAAGTVAYPSSDGASTAVQATNDGGVRMLSVITNADAPTDYPYNVSVPGGGSIQLVDGGGAVVVDGTGEAIASVGTPWATDASGNAVQTWFTTDGTTLTQHVAHNEPGVVYPVTADPWWNMFGNYLGCIFGIGIPIGLAIALAAYPPSWGLLIRSATSIGMSGRVGPIMNYLNFVHARCAAYFRG